MSITRNIDASSIGIYLELASSGDNCFESEPCRCISTWFFYFKKLRRNIDEITKFKGNKGFFTRRTDST